MLGLFFEKKSKFSPQVFCIDFKFANKYTFCRRFLGELADKDKSKSYLVLSDSIPSDLKTYDVLLDWAKNNAIQVKDLNRIVKYIKTLPDDYDAVGYKAYQDALDAAYRMRKEAKKQKYREFLKGREKNFVDNMMYLIGEFNNYVEENCSDCPKIIDSFLCFNWPKHPANESYNDFEDLISKLIRYWNHLHTYADNKNLIKYSKQGEGVYEDMYWDEIDTIGDDLDAVLEYLSNNGYPQFNKYMTPPSPPSDLSKILESDFTNSWNTYKRNETIAFLSGLEN